MRVTTSPASHERAAARSGMLIPLGRLLTASMTAAWVTRITGGRWAAAHWKQQASMEARLIPCSIMEWICATCAGDIGLAARPRCAGIFPAVVVAFFPAVAVLATGLEAEELVGVEPLGEGEVEAGSVGMVGMVGGVEVG